MSIKCHSRGVGAGSIIGTIMYSVDMEKQSLADLKADPKNPRFISKDDYDKLKKLLAEFGDLSGIVRNITTDELVGGHMRVRAFMEKSGEIQITQRFETPTKTGTVALGYVVIDNEPFTYREVQWPKGKQQAANIAANRAGGDWDKDLLAEVTYEISQLEDGEDLLALTGMGDDEISKLLGAVGPDPSPDNSESQERCSECGQAIKNAG